MAPAGLAPPSRYPRSRWQGRSAALTRLPNPPSWLYLRAHGRLLRAPLPGPAPLAPTLPRAPPRA
eukprot:3329091-Prymnesium_polylepis.2